MNILRVILAAAVLLPSLALADGNTTVFGSPNESTSTTTSGD